MACGAGADSEFVALVAHDGGGGDAGDRGCVCGDVPIGPAGASGRAAAVPGMRLSGERIIEVLSRMRRVVRVPVWRLRPRRVGPRWFGGERRVVRRSFWQRRGGAEKR